MAYVELHGAIRHHYKTNRLMKALKISRREAVGIVCTLAAWAIDNRPGGVIEKALIPDAIEWDRDHKEFLEAMIDHEAVKSGLSGWLDEVDAKTVKIHDWEDVTKGYLKSQEDAAKRTHKARVMRGEIAPDPDEKPNPDRSSSPEALAADAYMRWNPNATMRREKVIWEFKAAKKKANLMGDTGFMERLHAACMDEKQSLDVGVWDLLKAVLPKGKDEAKADEIIAHFQARDKRLKKEAKAQ